MSKYNPSDDGKTIDGQIIVYVWPPGDAPAASSSAPGSDKGSAKDAAAGAASGAAASAGAANDARSAIPPDGGLAARNNTLQDQNTAAGKQAETLAGAAKDAVPFCEKCAAAGHEDEAAAPGAEPAAPVAA